jgi:orotate phosphoribosyltransferase
MNNKNAEQLAHYLLQIKAIQLNVQNPFTWASGWMSPVYCDNRKLLSYPEVRDFVKNQLCTAVSTHFPDAEVIAGVATAGIPHGALVADKLGLPFIYVRPKPKEHGLNNTIEGHLLPHQKVVVIEDVISTGGSSLKAVEDLRAAHAHILGMAAIYTYGFDLAEKRFIASDVKLTTLMNYQNLIDKAIEEGYISTNELEALHLWRVAPDKWLR